MSSGKVLKAIDPNHPALADVGFSPDEWTHINLLTETTVATRVAKPIADPDAIADQSTTWSGASHRQIVAVRIGFSPLFSALQYLDISEST